MPSNDSKNSNNREKTKPHKVPNNIKRAPTKKRTTNNRKNVKAKKAEVEKKPQVKKGKKQKKIKFSDRHPKLIMTLKIGIVLFLLLCVIIAGIVAGMFFGLFGEEFEITKEELKIGASNSVIVDSNGGVIANLSGDEKRKVVTLEEMSDYLPKAYVAMEDERFYKHSGVDFKRTAGAIVNQLLGKSSYGGSTITQQVVKNITKEDEREGLAGIFRKVKEWAKAYQVERMISKSQILELYLNILYVGGEGNLHGVELGAKYYFNKSAKDLDLAECAYMAGINSAPSSYNPFDTTEENMQKIKNRVKTVLNKMKELGFIEKQEDYDSAIAKVDAGLPFSKGEIVSSSGYTYHTDAVIEQVIKQVMEERDISREIAQNYVYSSGLTIYSTVDANIQSRIEQETAKKAYIKTGYEKEKDGSLKNEHTQAAMVVIDHKTGYVLGVSGGLGEKNGSTLNRATQSKRQPGSSIKPIADIAPALQERIITAATVYDDVLTDFNGYQPKNDGKKYDGLRNIRYIIAQSKNVPEVKIMRELTPKKSINYLRNFGITSLYTAEDNPTHNDEGLPLAIGGLTQGISPLEMAGAYAAIANNGEYIEPTFYTKVEDSNGNVVLTPAQEKRRVISEQNAYIVKSILQEPVKSGTATYCAIQGMDVAAKTGTTDGSKDRWLCGFTPYYAAACWFGYDDPEEVKQRDFPTNPAGQIWDNVMTDIHKGLAKATFDKPSGIVTQNVCKTTGCIATAGCAAYAEIFTEDNLPEKCEGHGSQTLCTESNKVATPYCSQYCEVKENIFGGVIPKEQMKLWKPVAGGSSTGKGKVEETCTIHTKPKEQEKPKNNTTNTTNTTNTHNTTSHNTTSNTNTTNSTGNTTNSTGNTTNNAGTTNNTGGTNSAGSGNNTGTGNTTDNKKNTTN